MGSYVSFGEQLKFPLGPLIDQILKKRCHGKCFEMKKLGSTNMDIGISGVTTVLTMTFLSIDNRNDLPKVSYSTALDIYVGKYIASIISTLRVCIAISGTRV